YGSPAACTTFNQDERTLRPGNIPVGEDRGRPGARIARNTANRRVARSETDGKVANAWIQTVDDRSSRWRTDQVVIDRVIQAGANRLRTRQAVGVEADSNETERTGTAIRRGTSTRQLNFNPLACCVEQRL